MDQDALGTKVGLGPGHIVLDGSQLPPAPPKKKKGHTSNFRPMTIVVKRLDGVECHLVWG